MNKEITKKEMQMLSEYLDGRLSEKKRIQIKTRLQSSSELREELEQLSRTSLLLKGLPVKNAPRNFFITPEMAGKRITQHYFPAFRLASAIASLLFILVFAGSFILNSASQNLASSESPSLMGSQSLDEASRVNAQALIVTWDTPTSEVSILGAQMGATGGNSTKAGGGLETGQELGSSNTAEPGLTENVTSTPTPYLGGGNSSGVLPTPGTVVPPPEVGSTALPQTNTLESTQATVQHENSSQSGPILGINPGGTEVVPEYSNNAPSPAFELSANAFHVIEGSLGFLAILSGLIAFYFHQREKY